MTPQKPPATLQIQTSSMLCKLNILQQRLLVDSSIHKRLFFASTSHTPFSESSFAPARMTTFPDFGTVSVVILLGLNQKPTKSHLRKALPVCSLPQLATSRDYNMATNPRLLFADRHLHSVGMV